MKWTTQQVKGTKKRKIFKKSVREEIFSATTFQRRFDFFPHETEQTFYAVIILLDSFSFFFFNYSLAHLFSISLAIFFFSADSELATRRMEESRKKVSISLQSKVPPHYKSLFRLFNYISQNELRYRQENESGWVFEGWRESKGKVLQTKS